MVPLSGCIEHLKLNNQLVDLSKSKIAKGVQPGCNVRTVHVISMISERSNAVFHGASTANDVIDLTLRFKTKQLAGVLASVISDEQVTFSSSELCSSCDSVVTSKAIIFDNNEFNTMWTRHLENKAA